MRTRRPATRAAVAALLAWCALPAGAQDQAATAAAPRDSGFRDPATFRQTMERASEMSYVTLGGRQGLSGKLVFESNLALNLYALGERVGLELTPKIVVRMRADSSFTVRGPSYMPRATLHLRLRERLLDGEPLADSAAEIVSLTVGHHSNGQGGPFYRPDAPTEINIENGSFTSNYVELAWTEFTRGRRLTSSMVGLRVHVAVNESRALRAGGERGDQYGRYRVIGSARGRVPFSLGRWPMHSNVTVGWQYILDKRFDRAKFVDMDRVQLTVTYTVLPEILRETGIYVQYYRGRDYYNILYKSRLNAIRLGVALQTGTHLLHVPR